MLIPPKARSFLRNLFYSPAIEKGLNGGSVLRAYPPRLPRRAHDRSALRMGRTILTISKGSCVAVRICSVIWVKQSARGARA
jgi:hypothetical protein